MKQPPETIKFLGRALKVQDYSRPEYMYYLSDDHALTVDTVSSSGKCTAGIQVDDRYLEVSAFGLKALETKAIRELYRTQAKIDALVFLSEGTPLVGFSIIEKPIYIEVLVSPESEGIHKVYARKKNSWLPLYLGDVSSLENLEEMKKMVAASQYFPWIESILVTAGSQPKAFSSELDFSEVSVSFLGSNIVAPDMRAMKKLLRTYSREVKKLLRHV